jgi:hypothetical protein
MAFTYSLATSVGQLRLALSDTNAAAYGFEDAELEYLLSAGGSHNGAVILGLRTLLVDSARRTKAFSVTATGNGPSLTAYNDAARVAGLKEALRMYGGDLPTATVITPATQPYDSGYVEQPVVVTG